MKKQIGMALLLALALACMTGCGKKADSSKQENTKVEATTEASEKADATETEETLKGTYEATIDIKDYGKISLKLDADVAPITVTNFVKLAKEGFYDGLTFHRIIDGFMIQGGDPEGTGMGGSDQTIKGEFSSNGVENNISHKRGVISMARAQDPDSASSQFFIMQADGTYLDGEYAAFGEVTEGMEIVDKICKDTPTTDSNGTVEKENQPVINSITIK